jgi:hypothetical protein
MRSATEWSIARKVGCSDCASTLPWPFDSTRLAGIEVTGDKKLETMPRGVKILKNSPCQRWVNNQMGNPDLYANNSISLSGLSRLLVEWPAAG